MQSSNTNKVSDKELDQEIADSYSPLSAKEYNEALDISDLWLGVVGE